MLKKLFGRKKIVKKEEKYRVIVRWYHDTPWYLDCTMKDIRKFETNPDVVSVDIL